MVRFEIGASVTLVGDDLLFVGIASSQRIYFLVKGAVLTQLSGCVGGLTQRQKFQAYDRNRELLHEIARRLYELAPKRKKFQIRTADLI